MRRSLI